MDIFKRVETYVVSLLVGWLSHWLAGHPGVMDPFVTGTLAGAIIHAVGSSSSSGSGEPASPPARVGGSV